MLNQNVFKTGLAMLTTAFSSLRVTKENTRVWYNFFKDLTDEQFMSGVDFVVKTSTRIPTVAEIREAAISSSVPQLSADEAWEKVIHRVRSGTLKSDSSFDDERIERAVAIYYTDLKDMTSENRAIIRAQFMKTYNNLAERERKAELAASPKVKELINSIFQPSLGGTK